MKKLVEFTANGKPIYLQSSDTVAEKETATEGVLVTPTSKPADAIKAIAKTLESELTILHDISDAVVDSFRTAKNNFEQIEVEFGLSVSGKGTIYVVETKAEATLKVKLVFKAPRDSK